MSEAKIISQEWITRYGRWKLERSKTKQDILLIETQDERYVAYDDDALKIAATLNLKVRTNEADNYAIAGFAKKYAVKNIALLLRAGLSVRVLDDEAGNPVVTPV